jgi:hypothetical protein
VRSTAVIAVVLRKPPREPHRGAACASANTLNSMTQALPERHAYGSSCHRDFASLGAIPGQSPAFYDVKYNRSGNRLLLFFAKILLYFVIFYILQKIKKDGMTIHNLRVL